MTTRPKHYSAIAIPPALIVLSARPEGPGYQWIAYDSPQVVVYFHDGYTGKPVYAEGISLVDLEVRQ